jgi:hypothetical protein
MAIITVEQLKSKFEGGDYPRSTDYINLIDTLAALPEAGAGGGLSTVLVSSNITLSDNTIYLVDTSIARTLTLPGSPEISDQIQIIDSIGTASTYNITLSRNGNKINGETNNLIIDTDGGWYTLLYTGATYGWKVG